MKNWISGILAMCFLSLFSFSHIKKVLANEEEQKAKTNKKKENIMKSENSPLIHLEVEKYMLQNGLTVLLHPDKRSPQVYHQLLVKVGSKDEEEGKTGLAHLFEHMMFRGTAKYADGEYDKKLESIGATNNAFTSRDLTAYHVLLPHHKLEMILEMEAERLNSLRLTQSNLDKEKEVVKEERRLRTDNNPNEFFEPVMNLSFQSHSYRRPILGWMTDLSAMTLKDCKEFYESYYAPNNAVLVLSGNFEPQQAKKWIQKYYGALKPSQIKKPPIYKEDVQKKKRFLRLKRAIHAPTLVFAYKGPKAGKEGAYSLETLSIILAGGESARLNQLLVYEHKLALSVGSFYYALKEAGVFLVYVRMAPGEDSNKAKSLILKEIEKTRVSEVSEKELLKGIRSIMMGYVSAMKSLSGKTNSLSVNEVLFGDYRELFKDLDRYKKVNAQTIKEQTNLYLSPEKLSIVELVPEATKEVSFSRK